ncbi:MAG TPA: hypothetical protein VGK24_05690 [Candidatus Angelobacter sp.]|jgi:hypothetical protein
MKLLGIAQKITVFFLLRCGVRYVEKREPLGWLRSGLLLLGFLMLPKRWIAGADSVSVADDSQTLLDAVLHCVPVTFMLEIE